MQSKTSCFNRAVFRKTLSRCWPLWAGAAIILFFSLPFVLAGYERIVTFGVSFDAVVIDAAFNAVNSLPLFTCLFGLCFAAGTFSFLFSRRGTGLMASLPLKREGLFCSSFAAGLVMLLSVGLLTAALAAVILLTKGVHTLSPIWTWLGVYSMEAVTFYAIGVFCAMLTGSALVLVPLYGLVNFGGVFLCGMLQYLSRLLLVGVPMEKTLDAFGWLEKLSPCEMLLMRVGTTGTYVHGSYYAYRTEGWPVVIGYFIVGLAFAALSLALFKRRKMEYAQEPATGKALGQALKYIVTFYCALGLPAFLELFFGGGIVTSTPGLLLLTALGAAIGYLISEMILHKSAFVLKTSWKGLLITAAIAMVVMGAMKLDVFGYIRRVPDPAEVERADVAAYGSLTATITDADDLKALTELHRDLIDRQEPVSYLLQDLTVTYHLKNGGTLQRAYQVPDVDDGNNPASRLRSLLSRSDVKDASLEPFHALTADVLDAAWISWSEPAAGEEDADVYTGTCVEHQLTEKAALDLYQEGILPDWKAGAFPHRAADDADTLPSGAMVVIRLYWEREGSQELLYCLTPDAVNTLAWLAAHGYEIPDV